MLDQSLPLVVKLGGSLYGLPDLGPRLRRWLAQQPHSVVMVPGGGPAADVIRAYDRTHQLGEEASHWLALAMLTVNARFLAALLPGAAIASLPNEGAALTILDVHAFALADEARPDHLPHLWEATSDSLAVRVAHLLGANELVLLKSTAWRGDWQSAADIGVVDPWFPEALRRAGSLQVRVVDFRA
jgi:5-(aminomethyl)-3-furanmethanol phosphate kinase